MTSPSDRPTVKVFEEPWSVILVATGVIALQAGTGLQVLWLIVAIAFPVGIALRSTTDNTPPSRTPGRDDQSP